MVSILRAMQRSSGNIAHFGPTLARLLALSALTLAAYLEIRLSGR